MDVAELVAASGARDLMTLWAEAATTMHIALTGVRDAGGSTPMVLPWPSATWTCSPTASAKGSTS